jgi:hypothetical protein
MLIPVVVSCGSMAVASFEIGQNRRLPDPKREGCG